MAQSTFSLKEFASPITAQDSNVSGGKSAIDKLDLEDPEVREILKKELSIPEQKPQKNVFERIVGLLDAFRLTDDIRQIQKKGVVPGIVDAVSDPFKKVGTLITGEDYSNEFDKQGAAEILKDMGVKNKIAQGAGGFVFDVLLDPTTYVTIGTGAGVKILGKGGAKALTKAGTKVFQNSIKEGAEKFAKMGAEQIAEELSKQGIKSIAGKSVTQALSTFGKTGGLTVREIAEEVAKKKLFSFADSGVKVLKDVGLKESDQLAKQILKEGVFDKGGFKFAGKTLFNLTPEKEMLAKAYFDPVSSIFRGAKKVPVLSGIIDKAQEGGKKFASGALDTVQKLFNTRYAATGGNEARFGQLVSEVGKLQDSIAGATEAVRREYSGMFEQINKVLKNPEDAVALPHIIENLPAEKLDKLPDNIKQAIINITEQVSPRYTGIDNIVKAIGEEAPKTEVGADDVLKKFGIVDAEGKLPADLIESNIEGGAAGQMNKANEILNTFDNPKSPFMKLRTAQKAKVLRAVIDMDPQLSEVITKRSDILWGVPKELVEKQTPQSIDPALKIMQQVEGTKVQDKFGNPLKVYTGQKQGYSSINPIQVSKSETDMYGQGIYLTPKKEIADSYAAKNGRTYETFVDIKNPLTPSNEEDWYQFISRTSGSKKRDWLIKNGYDGIIDMDPKYPQILALNPEQVKYIESTVNVTDPLIKKAQEFDNADDFINAMQIKKKVLPVKEGVSRTTYKLSEVIDNKELFEKYPILRDLNVHLTSSPVRSEAAGITGRSILLPKDSYEFIIDTDNIKKLEKQIEEIGQKEISGKLSEKEYKEAVKLIQEVTDLKAGKNAKGVKLTDDGMKNLYHEIQHAKQTFVPDYKIKDRTDFLAQESTGLEKAPYWKDKAEIDARFAETKYKTDEELRSLWENTHRSSGVLPVGKSQNQNVLDFINKNYVGEDRMKALADLQSRIPETSPDYKEVKNALDFISTDTKKVDVLKGQLKETRDYVDGALTELREPHLARVYNELDISEAGARIPLKDEDGLINGVMAQRSTFPDWLPSYLRNRKDVDTALDAIGGEIPPKVGTKAREIYDIAMKRVDDMIDPEDLKILKPDMDLLDTLESQVGDYKKLSEKLDIDLDKKLSAIRAIKDPKLREVVDGIVRNIDANTKYLVDYGVIPSGSKATYIMREVTKTPSGKIIEEGGKDLGSGSIKKFLDPRNAVKQKKRFYDYLADLIEAGGETKITKTTGKESTANLVEALAKGELQVEAAKQFDDFAGRIIRKDITDANGKAIYHTIDDILQDNAEIFGKSYKGYVDEYFQTGKLAEPLKTKLENLGYQQLRGKHGVIPKFENAWFDPEAYEVMHNMHKQFFGDDGTNELVKMYDKVHNMIKKSQTVWFPAFHARNAFSNVFSNFMAGVKNPKVYADAINIQKYANAIASGNEDVIKKLGSQVVNGEKVSDLYNIMSRNGVLGNNFYSDLSEELIEKKGVGILSKINPVSDDFIPSQVGRKVGSAVEDNGRIGLFLDRLAKGDDTRSAALKVKEVLFDYGDLTDFEKNVMKRFVPFYTWTRKNAELQLRYILTQPGKYSKLIKGFNELEESFNDLSDEDLKKLPAWARTGVGVITGGGGKAQVIKQFGLPHEAFEQLISSNPLNQLGVLAKIPIELGTGQSIFKGKAILDDTEGKAFRNFPQFIKDRMGYREEKRKNKDGEEYTVYYVDPWAKYWMSNVMGRTQSEISKVSTIGDGGDVPMDLLNLFTGVKRYEFDLTEEEEKRNREQSKQMYEELLKRGIAKKYTNTYIPKEEKQNILSRINS